mmetsp:Transcript_20986/g.66851  ORF Transcript_20986/g.66851 Transcript_20986/m.66851 type:complete len:314 (-) Transcript_20986:60-1001(-)
MSLPITRTASSASALSATLPPTPPASRASSPALTCVFSPLRSTFGAPGSGRFCFPWVSAPRRSARATRSSRGAREARSCWSLVEPPNRSTPSLVRTASLWAGKALSAWLWTTGPISCQCWALARTTSLTPCTTHRTPGLVSCRRRCASAWASPRRSFMAAASSTTASASCRIASPSLWWWASRSSSPSSPRTSVAPPSARPRKALRSSTSTITFTSRRSAISGTCTSRDGLCTAPARSSFRAAATTSTLSMALAAAARTSSRSMPSLRLTMPPGRSDPLSPPVLALGNRRPPQWLASFTSISPHRFQYQLFVT